MFSHLVAVMLAADSPLPFFVWNESQAQLVLHRREPRLAKSVHRQTAVGIRYPIVEAKPAARTAVDLPSYAPAGADRIDRLLLR